MARVTIEPSMAQQQILPKFKPNLVHVSDGSSLVFPPPSKNVHPILRFKQIHRINPFLMPTQPRSGKLDSLLMQCLPFLVKGVSPLFPPNQDCGGQPSIVFSLYEIRGLFFFLRKD